jgi:hypothetical protein
VVSESGRDRSGKFIIAPSSHNRPKHRPIPNRMKINDILRVMGRWGYLNGSYGPEVASYRPISKNHKNLCIYSY